MSDPLDQFLYHGHDQSAATDPLDGYLADQQKASMAAGIYQPNNPDQTGKANVLARRVGLPPDTVERNLPDVQAMDQVRRAQSLSDRYPVLRSWLADPRYVGIGKDDLDNLEKNARYWKQATSGSIGPVSAPAPTLWNSLKGIATEFGAGFDKLRESVSQWGTDRLPSMTPQSAPGVPTLAPSSGQAIRNWQQADSRAEWAKPAFKSGIAGFGYDLTSSLAQMAPALAATALTGPAGGFTVAGAQFGGEAYGKYRARGATPEQAGTGAMAEGLANGAADALPLGYLVDSFGKTGMKSFLAGFLGRDLVGMEAQTVAQSAVDTAIANPDKTWGDFASELPENMGRAALMAVATAGLAGGAHLAATRLGRAEAQQQSTAEQASAIGKIMDAAAESKVRARDPEAFASLIAGLSHGTGAENLYVPAEKIAEYFQSNDMDYHSHDFWSGYSEQIDHGLSTGGDVVVPTSEAAAHLAGTPEWDHIKGDTRTSPGGFSLSEADAFEKSKADEMEKLGASLAKQFAEEKAASEPRMKVFEDVRDQLMQAGASPDSASSNAELVAARYETRAQRLGQGDAWSLYKDRGLEVHRVLPETLGGHVAADQLDLIIGEMKGQKDAKPDQGPSLLKWIADQGGVEDRGGDIASMGGKDWHVGKPGQKRLIKAHDDTGDMLAGKPAFNRHSPDDLALRAWEEGFFPDHTDRPAANDLLDAVGEGLRGHDRFAKVDDRETVKVRQSAQELRTLLESRGIDADKASRKEIAAEIEKYQKEQSEGAHYQQGDSPRGSISFGDGKSIVQLFESSNLSTFAHEMGHNWLEELRQDAERPDAPERLKADWKAVQDWFFDNGHASGTAIPTEAHELWARGFERYLMEGKAPSSTLRRVFDAFRGWLLHIYKVVQNLHSPITPEIREVMDRLVATDDEINVARERQRVQALFTDATEAGMSPEEFGAYQKATSDARDAAMDALLYRTMETIRKARTAEWKEEARTVRSDVTDAVNKRPEFKALHLLRTGKMLDRPDVEPVRVKLDRRWLVETYGEDILRDLPKGVPPLFTDREPMDADSVAEMVGFKSGDELVRNLIGVERLQKELRDSGDKRTVKQREIDEQTTATMRDRHGDPLNDGSIEEEALAAVHNERQGEVIASELRALQRKRRGDGPPTPYSVAKEWASRTVAEGKVSEVLSGTAIQRFARAAAKASKLAEEAMLKGDVDETFKQKQAQMLNNALVGEAGRAREEIDAAVKKLGRFAKAKTLKSMDQDYLDQIHGLLEDIDLRPRTAALERERADFATWAKAREEAGEEVVTPPWLAVKGGYQAMTVEALRGLSDTVDSIAHLGRMKKKLLVAKAEREFSEFVDEAVAKADPLPDGKVSKDAAPIPSTAGKALASTLKVEFLADELDGFDANGPWNEMLVHGPTEAANEKDRLRRQVLDPLATLFNDMSEASRRRIHDRVTVDELPLRHADGSVEPRAWRRADLLLMALHTGSESNLDKMERGEGWHRDTIEGVLRRELSADDWKFVEKAWRQVDSLWPEIARAERELTGVVPEKVEPRQFEVHVGTGDVYQDEHGQWWETLEPMRLNGGYWPVTYDPIRDPRAAEAYDNDSERMFGQHGRVVGTPKGHTVTRTSYAGPFMWSLESSLFNHLDRVTTRIAYGRYVRDALKFIRDPRVKETVIRKRGVADYQQLEPWLKGQVNNAAGNTREMAGFDSILKQARINATIVGLGFRIVTAVQHISYLSNSAKEVGPTWLAKGFDAMRRNMGSNKDFIYSRSEEMQHQAQTFDQNVRDAFAQMGTRFTGGQVHDAAVRAQEWSQKWAFWAMGEILHRTVAMPTWMAAYQRGMHEGMTDQEAARYGDKAVRRAQGGGRAKDLTAFQRAGEGTRQLGMFYSYFGLLLNQQREGWRAAKRGDYQRAAMTAFWFLMAEPLAVSFVKGQLPDDDESWGGWALRKMFFNLWGGVPGVRNIASGAERMYEGKGIGNQVAGVDIPISQAMVAVGTNFVDATKAYNGSPSDKWLQHAITTPGYFFGLPTGQPAATAQFSYDVATGKQQPETTSDWWTGVTKGRVGH